VAEEKVRRCGEPWEWEAYVSSEPLEGMGEYIHWEGHVYFRMVWPQPIWAPEGPVVVAFEDFPGAPVEDFERRIKHVLYRLHLKHLATGRANGQVRMVFEY